MNTQRLQTLATFLRTVPADHFNLRSWRSAKSGYTHVSDAVLESLECGTTGCAVGWACSMPEFQAQGLAWGTDGISIAGYPVYAQVDSVGNYRHSGWEAVEAFFDIDYSLAEHLFSSSEYADNATSLQVADRIESTIA